MINKIDEAHVKDICWTREKPLWFNMHFQHKTLKIMALLWGWQIFYLYSFNLVGYLSKVFIWLWCDWKWRVKFDEWPLFNKRKGRILKNSRRWCVVWRRTFLKCRLLYCVWYQFSAFGVDIIGKDEINFCVWGMN
jgi:hypothetical protein